MIKHIVTDIMGVTHPTTEIANLEGHFSDYGPEFLARKHEGDFASKIEQLKSILGTNVPEDLVRRVLEETGKRNLHPLFMEVMGAVNARGYNRGQLISIPYSDVLPAFHKWTGNEVGISTYSNGSSDLQRSMFNNYRGLDSFVSDFFSTAGIGTAVPAPKDKPEGYLAIADKYGIKTSEMMFLSDGVKEVMGADLAGIGRTIFVARPDNKLIQGAAYGGEKVTNLADIRF